MSNQKKKNFMSLYKPVHARFERFCKARVYGEMDFKDLMQETIAVAFEKFDSLKDPDAFLHFLFGISIRLLSNSGKKRREESLPLDHESIFCTGPDAEKQLEAEDLYKAMGALPEQQKEALILFEIVGFSIREIAQLQETSEDAVKKRLSRGRQELMKMLTEQSVIQNV